MSTPQEIAALLGVKLAEGGLAMAKALAPEYAARRQVAA